MTRVALILAAVMFSAPAWSAEPWQGRWAIDPIGCTVEGDTSETAPLFVTQTTIKWFVAHCRIGKMYKNGTVGHISANCSGEGRNYTIPIKLDPQGDTMQVVWDRAKPQEFRRCR